MNQQYEIHQRIFNFVVRGLKVVKFLPKSIIFQTISNQYIRALTSVGANDNEADGVSSKRDFIHAYTIVRKELKETKYWLRIMAEMDEVLKSRLQELLNENEELIKIVSAIITNAIK